MYKSVNECHFGWKKTLKIVIWFVAARQPHHFDGSKQDFKPNQKLELGEERVYGAVHPIRDIDLRGSSTVEIWGGDWAWSDGS